MKNTLELNPAKERIWIQSRLPPRWKHSTLQPLNVALLLTLRPTKCWVWSSGRTLHNFCLFAIHIHGFVWESGQILATIARLCCELGVSNFRKTKKRNWRNMMAQLFYPWTLITAQKMTSHGYKTIIFTSLKDPYASVVLFSDCIESFLLNLPIISDQWSFRVMTSNESFTSDKNEKTPVFEIKPKLPMYQEGRLPVVCPLAASSGLSASCPTLQPCQVAYGFQNAAPYLHTLWPSAWIVLPSPTHFLPSPRLPNYYPKPVQSHLSYLVWLTGNTWWFSFRRHQ